MSKKSANVNALITDYFKNVNNQIINSFKKLTNDPKFVRIKDEFIQKLKEIEAFNLNAYKQNSSQVNSSIKKLEETINNEEKLEIEKLRECLKKNCWFIDSTSFNEKTKLKHPLGVLVITDLHLPDEIMEYYRENCQDYTFDDCDQFFDESEKKEKKKLEKNLMKLMARMPNPDDDDDDDDYGGGMYGYDHGNEWYHHDYDSDDYVDDDYDDDDEDDDEFEDSFERNTAISQVYIARHDIFVKITDLINNETECEHIIDASCGSFTSLDYNRDSATNIDGKSLMKFSNLKSIDFSESLIDKVHKDAFKGLVNLENLNLFNCSFEYLPDNLFMNMNKLKTLSISLQHVKPITFDGLTNLENLELRLESKDKIEIWRMKSPFEHFKNLKRFKFEWMENAYYYDSYFENDENEEYGKKQVKDKTFLVKNSQVCSFLTGLDNLSELSLSGLSNAFFKPNCFNHMAKNLKVLNLENNSLSLIKYDRLQGLTSIQELSLAHNEISSIEENAFQDLTNLTCLKLNDNKIALLNESIFTSLWAKLVSLDLSQNLIIEASIDEKLLKKFNSLKVFELNNTSDQEKIAQADNATDAPPTSAATTTVLDNVIQKLQKIDRDSIGNSLKFLISTYFKNIKQEIESSTVNLTKKMNATEKDKLLKTQLEIETKINEIEAFNLKELGKNSDLIIARVDQLKKMKLEEAQFELRQYRELLKQNCWFVSSAFLKKKTNKIKYPLGILILTDLHLPVHRLQHFKKCCEQYEEYDDMAEKYEKKAEKMTPYQLQKLLTPYRYDPYCSSSDEDEFSVNSDDDKLVFSQDCIANLQIFREISEKIKKENKSPFIEANCSSINKLYFGGDIHLGLTSIDRDALKNFTNLTLLELSKNLINHIEENSFDSQHKLEILNLKRNQLKTLPDGLFMEMKSLKKLDLSENCLKKVCLKGLGNLEELSIEFNRKVNPAETFGLFENLKSLKKLFIKFSQDEDEDEYDDDEDEDEEEEEDDEEDVDEEEDDEKEDEKKKQSIEKIRLLNRFKSEFFKGLSNLVELRIEEADNKSFDIGCFQMLPNLVRLKLEKCSLDVIKRKQFTGLENKLEYLDLSNNGVELIEENSFTELNSLKELNLSKNKQSIRNFNKKSLRTNIKLVL